MKTGKTLTAFIAALFLCAGLSAQTDSLSVTPKKKSRVFFAYDARFKTVLDNREYDNSQMDASRTLFGADLGGGVGAGLRIGRSTHRLMAGIETLFELGGDIQLKPLVWYQLNMPLKHSDFQILAGCYSRSKVRGYYSPVLFSDANTFSDISFAGFHFNWDAPRFHYELGIDWRGQYRSTSVDTREQFVIYSAGNHSLIQGQHFRAGYAGYMHHCANNYSMTADNVIDDIIIYPYLENDFGPGAGVQSILLRLGYYQAIQRDRALDEKFLMPAKGQVYFELRHWNVGLVNDFLFGDDLMPYYGLTGPDGKVYDQSTLYLGDPMMARNANGKTFALYDKVGVYYEPHLLDHLTLRIQIDVHFNDGFAGWRQLVKLIYDFGN